MRYRKGGEDLYSNFVPNM